MMFPLPTPCYPARCPGLGRCLGRQTDGPGSRVWAPLGGAGGVGGGAWLSSVPKSPAVSLRPPVGVHQQRGRRATGPSGAAGSLRKGQGLLQSRLGGWVLVPGGGLRASVEEHRQACPSPSPKLSLGSSFAWPP